MITLCASEIAMLVATTLSLLYINKKYEITISLKSLYIWITIVLFSLITFGVSKIGVPINDAVIWGASLGVLFGVSIIDSKEKHIDKWLLLALLSFGAISLIRVDYIVSINKIIAAILFGCFILIISKIGKGIGGGDVKIIVVLSLIYNLNAMFSIMFYALITSLIYGIIYIKKNKKNMKEEIPFAPFLLIGVILYMLMVIING